MTTASSMTERLINAAVAYENAAGASNNSARKELFAARTAIEIAVPSCPYCGTIEGLRRAHDGYGSIPPEYICSDCFIGRDDGPCFDDLPAAVGLQTKPEMRARIRELAEPAKDDYDRAVLLLLDDFARCMVLLAVMADGKH